MRILKKISISIMLLHLVFGHVVAQVTNEQKDRIVELKNIISSSKNDTVRVKALSEWDEIIYISSPNLDLQLNERIVSICQLNLTKKLTKKEKRFFTGKFCSSLNNIGLIYRDLGNYARALDFYNRSLKIAKEINSKRDISNILNNMGIVFIDTKDQEKAIGYLNQSLAIARELGDSSGVASSYNNIGIIYHDRNELDKAYAYHIKSLQLREKIGERTGVSASLMNLGLYYQAKKEYETAVDYFKKAMDIAVEIENQKMVASALCYLGILYRETKDFSRSIAFFNATLTNAQESGEAMTLYKSSYNLFELYERGGEHKKALEMHKLFIVIRDSLDQVNSKKEALRMEYKHEYEKKAAADSVHNVVEKRAEKKLASERLTHEKRQKYFLYGLLALALVFAMFMFNRFRVTRKQKNTIEDQKKVVEEQKHLVEEKQREVVASIEYAKRIQQALLPSQRYIDKNLKRLGEK